MRTFCGIAMLALAVAVTGCGGGGSSKHNAIVSSGQNVVPITVNSGPTGNSADQAIVSVTVCAPSTSNCQTVPNILVDTGSSGLRILATALTVSLAQQTGAGGPMAECLPFISGFTWGPVQTADVQIGGEKASAVPIQVIGESEFPVPNACKSQGASMDTLSALGANGLLGVGLASVDCGPACTQTGNANPGLYYACPPTGCAVSVEAVAQQVVNPVALFATDNNGVIVELPAVTAPAATLSGSLVFGIGTQSNNGLGSAKVYTVDQFGDIVTTYKSQAYPNSFIDSGSNGYFFLDSAITALPNCTAAVGFYCPSSTQNFSATIQGKNGASGTVNFSVANAESLFGNGGDSVFGDLAGPGQDFDWGLPFFFGRNVYVAIEGTSTPGGAGPYWAY